ncbi:MAG: DUF4238 domain-containing protein [Elusimicrobia bacterium]|nr:DUF4238 domain-containing protein [Candidatus Liberimonas magnetica]
MALIQNLNKLFYRLLNMEPVKQSTITSKLSRDNHYIPIWYQRGFILPGENDYFYLDLLPKKIQLPNGKIKILNEVRKQYPKSCFFEKDLYTTSFLFFLNDEIEKKLFSNIDNNGSKAVKAVINNNFAELHHNFIKFFEYLDIQKYTMDLIYV